MLCAAGIVGLGIVWIAVTGYLARSQAVAVIQRIQVVKILISQGRIADARLVAQDIPDMARRAHRLTTGPAWWIGSHVPLLGDPLELFRGVTSVGEAVGADAMPRLMRVAGTLNPQALRSSGDTINLAPMSAARPQLAVADRAIARAQTEAQALPTSWFGPLDSSRSDLIAQLAAVRGYVDGARRAVDILPGLLGAHGMQRYFIGLQNEAELRGTGGLPGAFAIATVSHGHIHFTRFESDKALLPKAAGDRIHTGLDFGKAYDAAYGSSRPTSSYVDSNVSPHFPYAAQIWAAMWQKVSGQHVDGVLALDPTTLQYFLRASGPATLSNGYPISSADVVALTEQEQYALFAGNAERKRFVVAVLRAAAHQLTSGSGSALALVRGAELAATQHRLLVWSRNPATERALQATPYAGVIPDNQQPFSGVILNNSAGGKLDYYLHRSETYARSGCGPIRRVTVRITLRNDAPSPDKLPSYVKQRADRNRPASAKPGDSRVLLDYYATAGARLTSVSRNGKPATAGVESGLGHPIFRFDVELPRRKAQTIELHLSEPAGAGPVDIWRQPGVHPIRVRQSSLSTCG